MKWLLLTRKTTQSLVSFKHSRFSFVNINLVLDRALNSASSLILCIYFDIALSYFRIIGLESLKSKKKQTFRRRESLNKKGWLNETPSQRKIDEFLVPRKRKKVKSSQYMMMGCSDSFSWMPESSSIITGPRYRSNKRINKLIGKTESEGPVTRSRLSSRDFLACDEFSSLSNLKEIKHSKKSQLKKLKNDDFSLMFAWDEDSALSVQSHITRKFRKRKAVPLKFD